MPPSDLMDQVAAVMLECGFRQMIKQPPETFTAAEYAHTWGVNVSTARSHIGKAIKRGKFEVAGRGLNNAAFYRIKK